MILGLMVSPTEPRRIQELGKTSSVPETYGVDLMWASPSGRWGVQRKEISDLIASRNDGRLSKELGQMVGRLDHCILLVEGRLNWTGENMLMGEWSELSRHSFHGMLWSVRMRGVWVERSDSIPNTIEVVTWLHEWSKKDRHSGMRSRPNPAGSWGHVSSREWGIHLLSGMDGIGPTMAGRIYDRFGTVPMRWSVTKDELMEVDGIGEGRADKLMRSLQGDAVRGGTDG